MAMVISGVGTRPAGYGMNAPASSTCPWAVPVADDARSVSSRLSRNQAPSTRSTCPWNNDADVAVLKKTKKPLQLHPQDTCPWSTGTVVPKRSFSQEVAPPSISASQRLEQAVLRRGQLSAPSHEPEVLHEKEITLGPQDLDASADVADEDEERREIINRCLDNGLGTEQIEEILENYAMDKLLQKTRAQQERQKAVAAAKTPPKSPPKAPPSIAAKRMARAQERQSVSFGPNDSEVVGILEEGRRLTPLESIPDSLAQRRSKAKEASVAAVGIFDVDNARAAYMKSQQQAQAAKNKNRSGSGIF